MIQRRDNTLGTRSIKTCLIDLWLLHVYMLISTFWSAAWCTNSLSYRHITLGLGPTLTTLKNLCLYWYCKFKRIRQEINRGSMMSKVKKGAVAQWHLSLLLRTHVTVSCGHSHERDAPKDPSLCFLSLLVFCLFLPPWRHRCTRWSNAARRLQSRSRPNLIKRH